MNETPSEKGGAGQRPVRHEPKGECNPSISARTVLTGQFLPAHVDRPALIGQPRSGPHDRRLIHITLMRPEQAARTHRASFQEGSRRSMSSEWPPNQGRAPRRWRRASRASPPLNQAEINQLHEIPIWRVNVVIMSIKSVCS